VPEDNQQYLFAAVRVPEKIAEHLATIQRELAQQLKEHEQRHKLLSRRMFFVPVFDFNQVPMLSDEAVVLAFEQERASLPKTELTVSRIEAWPSPENMEQIVAVVEEDNPQFNAFRQAVSVRAEKMGFELSDDQWQPVIPLIRVAPNQEPCTFEIQRTIDAKLTWTVDAIEVIGRQAGEQRSRFQLRSKVRLNESFFNEAQAADDDQSLREEIAQQLRGRIEQRRIRLSENRRTELSKNLRVEEESAEPQPLN
jgi:2'-5' RNA ligase